MEKPAVQNAKLGSLLDDLYRPGAKIGSGSTAAAVRAELATGGTVGGRLHGQKAADYVEALQRWLRTNPAAAAADRAAAENVMRDLQNALAGR
jgi:filamentous hemagglutinin